MTTQPRTTHPFPSATRLALLCAGLLCADAAAAKKPHAARPASAPTTAQILAPSAATLPDPLPADRLVYRCGSTYSSRPCDTAQKPLDVADARSDAQRRQSQELTTRDKRLAAWYEAARHERERPASAVGSGRPALRAPVCTSTTTMTCVPKKPRKRALSVPGAASAALAGKAGN